MARFFFVFSYCPPLLCSEECLCVSLTLCMLLDFCPEMHIHQVCDRRSSVYAGCLTQCGSLSQLLLGYCVSFFLYLNMCVCVRESLSFCVCSEVFEVLSSTEDKVCSSVVSRGTCIFHDFLFRVCYVCLLRHSCCHGD